MTGFRPAQRSNTIPLIGLYGLSGSGKTMSALYLARGFVGEQGRLGMIDTERGRGQLYADVIPGGYEVMELTEPYTPDRYIEAIDAAIEAKLDALVIDSGSHEWEGMGGVLDQAAENERKSGKPGLHCWKEPKMKHQRFVLRLLSAPIPIIVCLRAKYKSRSVKNPRTGKQEIIKDDHTTPMQAEDFIFEMTAHAEVLPDHKINLTKCSHPALRECFPTDSPITVDTGRAVAAWARGGAQAPAQPPATEPAPDPFEAAKAAAQRGTAAFREWWNSDEGKRLREAVKPRLDELKQIAKAADEPAEPAEPDPFDQVEPSSGLYPVYDEGGRKVATKADARDYELAVIEQIKASEAPALCVQSNHETAASVDGAMPDRLSKVAREAAEGT